jgi:hypothetical protein
MQAVRKIQKADSDHISIKIPKAFKNRTLEVIVMLVDELIPKSETVETWPEDFFAKTAGCFADTPLVRENQGEYEVRDTIR